jgi:hypothetical protein
MAKQNWLRGTSFKSGYKKGDGGSVVQSFDHGCFGKMSTAYVPLFNVLVMVTNDRAPSTLHLSGHLYFVHVASSAHVVIAWF